MKSFTTVVFLAVTVIEEVAKVHMGLFCDYADERVKKDPLRNHKSKQIIGSNYTIGMGSRLGEAMGKDRLEEMFELSYNGNLLELRENSIYCNKKEKEIKVTNEIIEEILSRDILLFAIESFHDSLVEYSICSMEKSKITEEIFNGIVENS